MKATFYSVFSPEIDCDGTGNMAITTLLTSIYADKNCKASSFSRIKISVKLAGIKNNSYIYKNNIDYARDI